MERRRSTSRFSNWCPTRRFRRGTFGNSTPGEFGPLPAGEPRPTSEAFVWVVGYPVELAQTEGQQITLRQTSFAAQILECADERLTLHCPTSADLMPHNGTTCEQGNMTETHAATVAGRVGAAKPARCGVRHTSSRQEGWRATAPVASRASRSMTSPSTPDRSSRCGMPNIITPSVSSTRTKRWMLPASPYGSPAAAERSTSSTALLAHNPESTSCNSYSFSHRTLSNHSAKSGSPK